MSEKPRYQVNRNELPEIHLHPPGALNNAAFVAKLVHCGETSIMFADREPGYHTKPHMHDCEQVNYVVSGEIWFFVAGHGYHCRKGDIMRIPRNKLHWAWNRSDGHAEIMEIHSPRINTSSGRDKIVSLLGPDERADALPTAENKYPPKYDPEEVKAIEDRAIAADKAA